ncbi:MAG: hypothetical protein JWN02_2774 [Acidobacteria bacterium]|nr:hypothetical protein [Acidobacteriota bacterium]
MKRLAVAVILMFAVRTLLAQPHGTARGAVDWIFLLDTSKSMRGVGGSQNIFDDVKASIDTFVQQTSTGDSVTIYTFDRDVQFRGSTDIRGQLDRDDLLGIIRNLPANGERTHLGAAIAQGLERSESLLRRGDATRARAIVLLTDGEEDVRGIRHPISIPSNVQRVRTSRPWIFFVSMGGEHERQLDDFANAPVVRERTKVLRPRDPRAIREAMQQIRQAVQPPPPLEPAVLTVMPATIDCGTVAPGATSAERELTISSDKPVRAALRLEGGSGVAMEPQNDVPVGPGAAAHVKVKMTVADDLTRGPEALVIKIGAASGETAAVTGTTVTAKLDVSAPSPFLRVAKWLGALAVLLLLLFLGLALRSGKTPGELVASIAERNTLEGEIEIVQPRIASDAAFVGLPHMKARELALSAIVPIEALAGADARLFCRRKRGEKSVWIAANHGTLRVNDIEVPTSELYDADTIQIGEARLRFNRLGHQRPSTDSTFEA